MEPATAAGLALAILPLIVAALENYEYTFQPVIIYSSRYRKEVKKFQDQLKVENFVFRHECHLLLRDVTSDDIKSMLDNPKHVLWSNKELEARLEGQLNECCEACISALRLINEVLQDIAKSTGALDILLDERQARVDKEFAKRIRQRLNISFSKNRFDDKLKELRIHLGSLKTLRERVTSIKEDRAEPKNMSTEPGTHFRLVQRASSRLYEALSSLWQCEVHEEHVATICLDSKQMGPCHKSRDIRFDLTWMCPAFIRPPNRSGRPIQFSIEAVIEKPPVDLDSSDSSDPQRDLAMALDLVIRSEKTGPASTGLAQIDPITNSKAIAAADLPDLFKVPNLCNKMRREPPSAGIDHRIGFLQKTETFKHVVYLPLKPLLNVSSARTLEDALNTDRGSSDRLSLPGRIDLAQSLAWAMLHFHSTQWLTDEWQGQDVVFFDAKRWSTDSPHVPCLKSSVLPQPSAAQGRMTTAGADTAHKELVHLRSPVQNQTAFSLGIMLIELAYDRQLKDLQIPQDDHGDSNTRYWAAKRLAGEARRKIGRKYATAVKLCLEVFGTSRDFNHPTVQGLFHDEVVQTLKTCAEAVAL